MQENILEENIENAPPKIKNVLVKKTWVDAVDQISTANNLSSEQKTALENEVIFILLGMSLLKDLPKAIVMALNVQESVATKIGMELYEKIFKDLETYLPTDYEEGVSGEEVGVEPEVADKDDSSPGSEPPASVPEIAPEIHPVVEGGEEAHEVAHVEPTTDNRQPTENQEPATDKQPKKDKVGLPDYRYPGGQDPYREPLN